ncbi:pyridine nucleotide-disulfide oxidoreductase, partial [Bacteroides xylanisolvens]
KRGYSFKVSRLPASSIVRTRTLRQTDGMLKAIINNHNGKIMGCTLFCADASEIINIVAMAIKTGQTSTFLRDFIFTHPSMSEGLNQLFDV